MYPISQHMAAFPVTRHQVPAKVSAHSTCPYTFTSYHLSSVFSGYLPPHLRCNPHVCDNEVTVPLRVIVVSQMRCPSVSSASYLLSVASCIVNIFGDLDGGKGEKGLEQRKLRINLAPLNSSSLNLVMVRE